MQLPGMDFAITDPLQNQFQSGQKHVQVLRQNDFDRFNAGLLK